MTGNRGSDGLFSLVGGIGVYWSNTITGSGSRFLYFASSDASINSSNRSGGYSARCIKD
jgi:hypothetical protein